MMIHIGLPARAMGKVKRIPSAELETLAAILRTLVLGKQIGLGHRLAPDSASGFGSDYPYFLLCVQTFSFLKQIAFVMIVQQL